MERAREHRRLEFNPGTELWTPAGLGGVPTGPRAYCIRARQPEKRYISAVTWWSISSQERDVIRSPELLERLDRRYARERLASRTYPEALAIFEALWREARQLNPGFPGDWRDDIGPDLNVARALNGLPPVA